MSNRRRIHDGTLTSGARIARIAWIASIASIASSATALGCGARSDLDVDYAAVDGGSDVRDTGFDAPLDADVGLDADADVGPEILVDARPDVPVEACPKHPPASAGKCSERGQVCTYHSGKSGPCSDASDANTSAWRCERDGWSAVAECVRQTGCPASMPNEGDACSLTQGGLDCFYPTDGCAEGAIAQCVLGLFHRVNDCGRRSTRDGCTLLSNGDLEKTQTVETLVGTASRVALSTVGTQDLFAYLFDDGTTDATPLRIDIQQSAEGSETRSTPSIATTLGGSAAGPIALTSLFDRWTVAFSGDGTAAPAVHWSSLSTHGATAALGKSPRGSSLESIARAPGGGWLAVREASSAPGKSRVSLVAIDASGAPVGGGVVVSDEGAPSPPPIDIPPVGRALARVIRRGDGFVVAYSAPATGDLLDDSGIELVFVDAPAARTLPTDGASHVRLLVGSVGQLAIAAMQDGSVVVAHTPYFETALPPRLDLDRVSRDHSIHKLPPIAAAPARAIAGGVDVQPFDDAFVVSWQSVSTALGAGLASELEVSLRGLDGATITGRPYDMRIPRSLDSDAPFAIAASPVDRTVHIAFVDGTTSPNELHFARAMCRPGT